MPETIADRMRAELQAVRLKKEMFGVWRVADETYQQETSQQYDADADFTKLQKKIINDRHPLFKAVTKGLGAGVEMWKAMTLPFTLPGVRLIRIRRVAEFIRVMGIIRGEVVQAVEALDKEFPSLRLEAEKKAGRLFNASEVPLSIKGEINLSWSFPSVEPDKNLLEAGLAQVYQQERERVTTELRHAAELAKDELTKELAERVERLAKMLCETTADGRPKRFIAGNLENLHTFFDRFKNVNLGDDDQLNQLVERAQKMFGELGPDEIRKNSNNVRSRIVEALEPLNRDVGKMMEVRRRRVTIDVPPPLKAELTQGETPAESIPA